ncbi:MAG: hypothetical protein Fur0022_44590 [Anaerolineales bacterium]
MPTQYLTFILRVRLETHAVPPDAVPPDAVPPDAVPPDAVPPDNFSEPRVSGSLQQAGAEQVYYFDSFQKLQDALAKNLPLSPPSATP